MPLELNKPLAAVADNSGKLYISDNKNIRVRLVSGGTITTYAGTGGVGSSGDGGPAISAQLRGPNNLGMDAAGNLYIADEDDNRIRRVNKTTLIINTVAGNGDGGYSGDGGPAIDASIATPFSAAFDAQGRMYIAQFGSDVVRLADFYRGAPPRSPWSKRFSADHQGKHQFRPERLTVAVRDSNGIGVSGVHSDVLRTPASGASATPRSPPPTAITDARRARPSFSLLRISTAGSYSVTATTTGACDFRRIQPDKTRQ